MNIRTHLFTFVSAILMFAACKKKGEEVVVYPNPASSHIILDATATWHVSILVQGR